MLPVGNAESKTPQLQGTGAPAKGCSSSSSSSTSESHGLSEGLRDSSRVWCIMTELSSYLPSLSCGLQGTGQKITRCRTWTRYNLHTYPLLLSLTTRTSLNTHDFLWNNHLFPQLGDDHRIESMDLFFCQLDTG